MKSAALIALLIIYVASPAVLAQDSDSGVVVLKCSWQKERLRPIPSAASLASQDELIQQSRKQQELATAKSTSNRTEATKLETQISNHEKATIKAQQTELPRDGYRYKVTLRNDGTKTIKSIDWDYFFYDPNTQQELAHHQFTSDETIKPGKSKEISVLYLIPPLKTVDVRSLRSKERPAVTETVVVARLQFSDGSVWQHP